MIDGSFNPAKWKALACTKMENLGQINKLTTTEQTWLTNIVYAPLM